MDCVMSPIEGKIAACDSLTQRDFGAASGEAEV
jgi:hypothetical protein